jgi:hypothetical protein
MKAHPCWEFTKSLDDIFQEIYVAWAEPGRERIDGAPKTPVHKERRRHRWPRPSLDRTVYKAARMGCQNLRCWSASMNRERAKARAFFTIEPQWDVLSINWPAIASESSVVQTTAA